MITNIIKILWCLVILTLTASLFTDYGNIRRPDTIAHKLYSKGEYQKSSEIFTNTYWQAIALYRAGKFKEAANIFAGYNTTEGCFNQGNALVFQGQYTDAVQCYERALEFSPNWEAAIINRDIALERAKLLETEGGEGTGGKLGADDTVISNAPKDAATNENDQTETIEEAMPLSDAELRAIWLRQVQTDPADFLKSKFSYQASQEAKK